MVIRGITEEKQGVAQRGDFQSQGLQFDVA